jgi:hypothetical protein
VTVVGSAIKLGSGKPVVIQTPRIADAHVITDSGRLAYVGVQPGSADLNVELRTSRGTYSARTRVVVQRYKDAVRPLRNNFSGSWILQLGAESGSLTLQDDSSRLSGRYAVGNERGDIGGWHDGTTLHLSLQRNPKTKWVFDTNFEERNGYLYAEGDAHLSTIRGGDWSIVQSHRMKVTAQLATP